MDRVLKAARASGSLNLSNRSLTEVPDEVYNSLDAVGGDEKWWEAVELQKLILAHNDIASLKEDLKNLQFLAVLNLSHNKLSKLLAAIGELQMLKSLDVSFNSIVEIPEEIGSTASLVKYADLVSFFCTNFVCEQNRKCRFSWKHDLVLACDCLLTYFCQQKREVNWPA